MNEGSRLMIHSPIGSPITVAFRNQATTERTPPNHQPTRMNQITRNSITANGRRAISVDATANRGIQPREVDVSEVRQILRGQGAHLHDDAAVEAARSRPAVPAK